VHPFAPGAQQSAMDRAVGNGMYAMCHSFFVVRASFQLAGIALSVGRMLFSPCSHICSHGQRSHTTACRLLAFFACVY
jgi:hypothetical protein